MDLSLVDKGPAAAAVLQLQRWGPSLAHLNLSEFRQAFISPTRQLLLLLSYHSEALFIPLLSGDSTTGRSNLETGSGFCSQPLTPPGKSDSIGDDSVLDFDNDFTFDREIARSENYPFVGDVNSLAWGICEDNYDQNKDALFSEILFVSGKQGLVVHAFVESTRNTDVDRNALHGEYVQGRWVEWGPSASLVENTVVEEATSLSVNATGNIDLNRANGDSESPHNKCNVPGNDELPKGVASKKWLQSFLTKVETVEYNGNILTKFPEKSLFPCSAKVVSFGLFNSNLPFLDFLSNSDSVSNECTQETIHKSESDNSINTHLTSSGPHFKSEILSNIFGFGMNCLYKCSRVFSSNSHCFIGFVFTQVDPVTLNTSDESEITKKNNVLLVARLDRQGIQCVSSVKLDECPIIGSVVQWTDFQFSDSLLICLNASGLVVFYGVMSGEYVAHFGISQTLGLNPQLDFHKQGALSLGSEKHSTEFDGVDDKRVLQHGDYSDRRMFKRLIAASHTSLIAVVDDYGVIYVISAGDYIPGMYYENEKLLPHIQQQRLGMLGGWEVGGCDIGHQRVYSNISGSQNSIVQSMTNDRSSFLDDCGSNVLRNQELDRKQEGKGSSSFLGRFSASKLTDHKPYYSENKPHLMRKIFLPPHKFREYDPICFSPLGITRLVKNRNMMNPKGSHIVHLNLHAEFVVCDDNFLNTRCEMFYLQGREEAFIGEAVGCTFQGCFYLVTESGLSVVLPSVSVSSNFLPLEVIGCGQLTNSGTGDKVKSTREMKESQQPWSPWNVEILDRVHLYESAEEADRLCLENGWNLKVSRMHRLQLALDYLKFDEIERLCLGAWLDHGERTGGFYACNRYETAKQEGVYDEAEKRREMAKNSLERYTHYYERWATNQSSRQKALADLQQMQTVHLEKLSDIQCQPESQLKFITEAWLQIVECRRVLKWTYAYGYYLPEHEHAKRRFFEYLQGEAESGLERLHQCAEKELQVYLNDEDPSKDFNEFRTKLAGLTSVTRNYFENLVRALENGLSDVDSHGACSRTVSSKCLGGSSKGRGGRGKATTSRSSGLSRNIDDLGHWSCEHCTFANVRSASVCQMCQQRR